MSVGRFPVSCVTANLELSRYFARIHLWADESPAEESPWFSFAPVQGEDGDRRELTLFCSSRSFAPVRNLQGPESAAGRCGKLMKGAWLPDNELHRDFDLDQGAKFLHHNLLLARDLVSGEGQLDRVPRELVEGYQAAWEVVIDGRLARLSLPGYSLAERRARFSRLFSSAEFCFRTTGRFSSPCGKAGSPQVVTCGRYCGNCPSFEISGPFCRLSPRNAFAFFVLMPQFHGVAHNG